MPIEFGPVLPEAPHETLKNPPLKAMFGQVRFPTLLTVADPAILARFQATIRERLPEYNEEQHFSVMIGPGGPQQQVAGKTHRFSTSDGHWSVGLSPDNISLEAADAAQYTSYEEFKELFALTWAAAVEVLGPTRVLQQGLRYIDHIEGEHSGPEWARYISAELLGPAAHTGFAKGLFQSLSELRYHQPDGATLVVRHGIAQAGPENTPGYLLDFDYFNAEPLQHTEVDALIERFDAYHELLWRVFHWSVTPAALDEFRG